MRDDFRRLSPDARLRSPHGGEELTTLAIAGSRFKEDVSVRNAGHGRNASVASPPDGQILVVRFEPGVFSPQRHGQVSRIGNGN
jgi:hypothetical protein